MHTQTNTPPLNNLNDWLTYMHSIHVSAIDMGLSRVIPVFEKLNIQKKQAFVFTVAGTNGKGSTTATIAKICQQAGYKTALYQSPHLIHFNERIQINGEPVNDERLIQAFQQVENARIVCNLTLSFFEMTTLAGLLIFAEANCDVWVLEIGLGGRLDVVNVIDPDLAVITNIGIDHVDWLGDTREKIAIEKAGILRTAIPLIYGEIDMPNTILPIIEQYQNNVLQYGIDFSYISDNQQNTWQYSNSAVTLSLPLPNLSIHNTAVAITACLASRLNISQQHLQQAIPKVHLAGRFDKRQFAERAWLFDVAHNEHGISFLLQQFLPYWQQYQQNYPNAKLHLIFSMLADKDIQKVLEKLQKLPISQVYTAKINHYRACELVDLTHYLTEKFNNICSETSLEKATKVALKTSYPQDMILVCGSFFTIAEVLNCLN